MFLIIKGFDNKRINKIMSIFREIKEKNIIFAEKKNNLSVILIF